MYNCLASSSGTQRRRIQISEHEPHKFATISNPLERLPLPLLTHEILLKLDLLSLCSLSCTNKSMHSASSLALSLLPSLQLYECSLDARSLSAVARRCGGIKSVVLNCLHLDDEDVGVVLNRDLEELCLFNCPLITCRVLDLIGKFCPCLRVLMLEFAFWVIIPDELRSNLGQMFSTCRYLESLSIKIRSADVYLDAFGSIEFVLPKRITSLKLYPVLERHSVRLINELRLGRGILDTENLSYSSVVPFSSTSMIQHLSLKVDVLSDELIISITNSLPGLIELDLEDRPEKESSLNHDLTNSGIQSLGNLCHLKGLSLVRSRQNDPSASFRRINDMGMFLFSEGCKKLVSVRLWGFSKVSDAGFASILHSCRDLQKFEVHNASLLSDLAFHDLTGVPCSLVEVKLLSCNLITSDTVEKLACSSRLEMLNLSGCRSVADACLVSISCLSSLTSINLSGADVTDGGLSVLGKGTLSITSLSLRGCKRVTDRGVSFLFSGGGTIRKTLTTLDLGYMPRISDKAIHVIVAVGMEITELCIRNCFYITDSSIELLANKGRLQGGSRPLKRLDLFNCTGLSTRSLRWLSLPSFHRLLWLGAGLTRWTGKRVALLTDVGMQRPWLTICFSGCEMGCYDGWQFHGEEQVQSFVASD